MTDADLIFFWTFIGAAFLLWAFFSGSRAFRTPPVVTGNKLEINRRLKRLIEE